MKRETNNEKLNYRHQKDQINSLHKKGRLDEATTLLVWLIEESAANKRFTEAENLREWLIELDPMALSKIVRTAEIIEEAKFTSIDEEYIRVWGSLIKELTREEFSALYHSMILKRYQSDSMVVKQGDFLRVLFFINRGFVQLFTKTEGGKVALVKLGAGRLFGGDSFFDPSVWTFSAISKGAELFVLPYTRLQTLDENYPSLEGKLLDFSAHFQIPDLPIKRAKKGRRRHYRNKISGRTAIELLDKNGSGTGRGAKGDLYDISKGGVSCSLHVSKKHNAFKLFGKRIRALIPSGNQTKSVLRTGIIVAVRGFHVVQNEYSVHIQFDKLLNDFDMQRVVAERR